MSNKRISELDTLSNSLNDTDNFIVGSGSLTRKLPFSTLKQSFVLYDTEQSLSVSQKATASLNIGLGTSDSVSFSILSASTVTFGNGSASFSSTGSLTIGAVDPTYNVNSRWHLDQAGNIYHKKKYNVSSSFTDFTYFPTTGLSLKSAYGSPDYFSVSPTTLNYNDSAFVVNTDGDVSTSGIVTVGPAGLKTTTLTPGTLTITDDEGEYTIFNVDTYGVVTVGGYSSAQAQISPGYIQLVPALASPGAVSTYLPHTMYITDGVGDMMFRASSGSLFINGPIQLYQSASTNNVSIFAHPQSNGFGVKKSTANSFTISANNTVNREYTLPDISGSFVLCDNTDTGSNNGNLLIFKSNGNVGIVASSFEKGSARRGLSIPHTSRVWIESGSIATTLSGSVSTNAWQAGNFVGNVASSTSGLGRYIPSMLAGTPGYFPCHTSSISKIDWDQSWSTTLRMANRVQCGTTGIHGRFTTIIGNPQFSPQANAGHNLTEKGVAIKMIGSASVSQLFISAHNGVSEQTSSVSIVTDLFDYVSDYELDYLSGNSLKLYRNDVLISTISASALPSGGGNTDSHLIGWLFENNTSGSTAASTHYIQSVNVTRD